MLSVDELTKRYQVGDETVRAVDRVTLHVAAGELVAIYGPSGSGKSTLLDLIAGFQRPDSGTVRVNGLDVTSLSAREHADYLLNVVGIVGQPNDLMQSALARENAALKLLRSHPRHAHRLIEPLLIELGLGKRMNLRTSKLSMGERQRVMIAQALSTEPQLLLADEPTGNLDRQRSREVLALLHAQCQARQMAGVIATHDPEVVAFVDRAFELNDGQLGQIPEANAPAAPNRTATEQ